MKILQQKDVLIHVLPGDTFILHHDDGSGDRVILEQPIAKSMKVDTAMVVEIEKGELGLRAGIAGVVGEKLEPRKKSKDGGQP